MNNYDIANMTVSEFRKFKKALRVLQAAGLSYSQAVEVLTQAHADRIRRIA